MSPSSDCSPTDLSPSKPELNALQKAVEQRLPVHVPWHRSIVRLGASFDSRRAGKEAWVEATPFLLADLVMIPKVLRRENGTDATYFSRDTYRLSESSDHLSLGFGASVGPPGLSALASVSVKGQYDKDVVDNKDSEKSSIHSTLKAGAIELLQRPRLTDEAIKVLKYGGGYSAFCDRYGDYYVAGYSLGGETGFLLSSSTFSKKKIENFSIRVAVKVLIAEVSKTWTKEFHEFSSGRKLRLIGFDTLDGMTWNETTEGEARSQVLQSQAKEIILRSQCLRERVEEILQGLGLPEKEQYDSTLRKGQELSQTQCDALLKAGAVVELLLLPMRSIREVARWMHEDNVI